MNDYAQDKAYAPPNQNRVMGGTIPSPSDNRKAIALSIMPNDVANLIQMVEALNGRLESVLYKLTGTSTPEQGDIRGNGEVAKEVPILEGLHRMHNELQRKLGRSHAVVESINSVI